MAPNFNNNGNNNNVNNGKANDTPRLEWDAEPFDKIGETTRINSKDLARKIKEKFQLNFHDCVGCKIDYMNGFKMTLYFEYNQNPVPDGKIRNLVNFADASNIYKNDIVAKMQYRSRGMAGKTFDLNEDTKTLLREMMFGGFGNHKINWKEFVSEIHDRPIINMNAPFQNFNSNVERILIAVTGFDINVVVRKLFGTRMIIDTVQEDGKIVNVTSNARYKVNYANKVFPDGSFMINIERFSPEVVTQMIAKETPQVNYGSSVVMY